MSLGLWIVFVFVCRGSYPQSGMLYHFQRAVAAKEALEAYGVDAMAEAFLGDEPGKASQLQ